MQHWDRNCGRDVLVMNTMTLRSCSHRCAEKVTPKEGTSLAGGFVSWFCATQILILRVSSHLILCTKYLQYSPQSGINPQVRLGMLFFFQDPGNHKLSFQEVTPLILCQVLACTARETNSGNSSNLSK